MSPRQQAAVSSAIGFGCALAVGVLLLVGGTPWQGCLFAFTSVLPAVMILVQVVFWLRAAGRK